LTIISSSGLNKKLTNLTPSKKRNKQMYEYEITIKINAGSGLSTAKVRLWANNDYDAKALAEMQYGRENVICHFRIHD
jgi:hypothetical protein